LRQRGFIASDLPKTVHAKGSLGTTTTNTYDAGGTRVQKRTPSEETTYVGEVSSACCPTLKPARISQHSGEIMSPTQRCPETNIRNFEKQLPDAPGGG